MPLATFGFGVALLTTLEFAFLVVSIGIVLGVVTDISCSHDFSRARKTLWMLCVLGLPIAGLLGYLAVRSHAIHEQDSRTRQDRLRRYLYGAASGGLADDLAKLVVVGDGGMLVDVEGVVAKSDALA